MAKKSFDLQSLKVLLIEDSENMSHIVKQVLVSLGVEHCNIRVANDGADALRELKLFPADFAICDWIMEPVDGIEFTKMIRVSDDSPNPFLPIILLTGHTEINRVVEARDAGVNEYVAKPISAKSLYSRIYSIIDNPRSFVRTSGINGYFGPDRRRKVDPTYKGEEWRKGA